MRLPLNIPLKGWTTDAPYTEVPQGMSLDLLNVIPNDQYHGRMRLGLRPALTLLDVISTSEIQCLVPCSNYAETTSGSGVYVRTDRTLIVTGGKIYQMRPGVRPTVVDAGTPLKTTGRVSGIQFKEHAYFCDGTNYHKVNLMIQDSPVSSVWTSGAGPNAVVNAGANLATIITRFGARVAMAGVETARESWFLSAIDDPEDWTPDAADSTDAVAGGSGVEYGSIGEPITALVPFGTSGLLIAGKRSLTYLTGDPAFSGTAMHSMSRSLGLVGPNAWCAGPSQSVFVLSEEGLLYLTPNMFDVDKSAAVSRGRLDSFFQNRRWYDLDPVLVHDVARSGVWIFLNDTSQPTRSDHLFYSYATDGFFPIELYHPRFTGAVSAVHSGINTGGADTVVMGSADGVIATFDPNVICGSDGQTSSAVTWNTWTDTTTSILSALDAGSQRIESHLTMGPIAGPAPNEVLIREVTVEAGLDDYLPDTSTKGTTSKPRVELVYGESPQQAVGSDITSVTAVMKEEIILDCGYWDAADSSDHAEHGGGEDVTIDGGTQSSGYKECNYLGEVGSAASDDNAIDGGVATRMWDESRWTANDMFTSEEERRYEPVTDSGFYLVREAHPDAGDDLRWVVRYADAGWYYDSLSADVTLNPIHYVQQPDANGNFPLSLKNQTFHGMQRTESSHPANSEYGTFDSDTADDQWNDVTDPMTAYAYHRQDIIETTAGTYDEVGLLDMGCVTTGRGNRRRCRIRCLTAFLRIKGETINDTSGYPYTIDRVTIEADVVTERNDVEVPDCEGSGVESGTAIDPTTGEPLIGACCAGDDGCTQTTRAVCEAAGSYWVGGDCEEDLCLDYPPVATGSCCFIAVPHHEHGWCIKTTHVECINLMITGPYVTAWTEDNECPSDGTECP